MENGNHSSVPGLSFSMPVLATAENYPRQPLIAWSLLSVTQRGAMGRRIHHTQGKALGGGSALNTKAFHRGPAGSYQRWANIAGDESFTYPGLLPFFKKSPHLTPPDLVKRASRNTTLVYDASAFDPSGGPLQVSWSNWVDAPLSCFQRAFTAIGLPISKLNFNSGSLSGSSAYVLSTINPHTTTRSSSQTSFLDSALSSSNLYVYTHAHRL